MEMKSHWEHVYASNDVTSVSWFQAHSELSIQIIEDTGIPNDGKILDVGGGASTLVDDLLDRHFTNISVLDISASALNAARTRLGHRASEVDWLAADITTVQLPKNHFDLWHDRAVFHFLTQIDDRRRYVDRVVSSVKPGGHVIVATFAPDGPLTCSGLDVCRYSPQELHAEFGSEFILESSAAETHRTPFGTEQRFNYCYCRRTTA